MVVEALLFQAPQPRYELTNRFPLPAARPGLVFQAMGGLGNPRLEILEKQRSKSQKQSKKISREQEQSGTNLVLRGREGGINISSSASEGTEQ
jgi:hypothetical protein